MGAARRGVISIIFLVSETTREEKVISEDKISQNKYFIGE